MKDRWEEITKHFERARQLHGGGRSEYLEQVCGDDARFRAEIEALLAAADATPSRPRTETVRPAPKTTRPSYAEKKPEGWEAIGFKDAFMFKVLFTLTRFWGLGDNLKRYWLSHCANHANFLARHFVTKLDGEDVPYSVSENAGVCSSCAEFFNVVEDGARKLVRACPGSVIFGGAERDIYLDVKPVRIQV